MNIVRVRKMSADYCGAYRETSSKGLKGVRGLRVALAFLVALLLLPLGVFISPTGEVHADAPPSTWYGSGVVTQGFNDSSHHDGQYRFTVSGAYGNFGPLAASCDSPGCANVPTGHAVDYIEAVLHHTDSNYAYYSVWLRPIGSVDYGVYESGYQWLKADNLLAIPWSFEKELWIAKRSTASGTGYYNGNPDPSGDYNLSSSQYSLYRDNNGSPGSLIKTITLNEDWWGTATGNFGMVDIDGVYWIKETTAATGFSLNPKWYYVWIPTGNDYSYNSSEAGAAYWFTNGTADWYAINVYDVPKGSITLKKASSTTSITNGNDNYSLAGAVFGVYDTEANAKAGGTAGRLTTITTNATGAGTSADLLDWGTYFVREITAPTGFVPPSAQVWTVILDAKTKAVNNGSAITNVPYSNSHSALVKKVDADGVEVDGAGGFTLANAEFTVRYWDGYYSTVAAAEASGSAMRTWVFKTQEDEGKGIVRFNADYFLRGSALYYNSAGKVVFPLGTVVVQETKAPVGYLLNTPENPNTPRVFNVVATKGSNDTEFKDMDNGGATLAQANELVEQSDQIIRSDVYLTKGKETNQGVSTILEPEADVTFDFYGPQQYDATTGEPLEGVTPAFSITTDADGHADTSKLYVINNGDGTYSSRARVSSDHGGVPYGTYLCIQRNAPEDVIEIPRQIFVFTEDSKHYSYTIKNDRMSPWAIQVVKHDAETDEVIPLCAQWQVIDRETDEPVVMTTYYPDTQQWDTFTSDENGHLTLPEKLPFGRYQLREVLAPASENSGYLRSPDDLTFEVAKNEDGTADVYDWDTPFVLDFFDLPAKGIIEINKTDEITSEAVAGAAYEVRAAQDIFTPDGTLRVAKDTVVAKITTDLEGKAKTDELYLGNYLIREVASPDGYTLDDREHAVSVVYEDQDTSPVTALVEVTDYPTTLLVKKVMAGTDEPLAGVGFRLDAYLYAEPDYAEIQAEVQKWLGAAALIGISYDVDFDAFESAIRPVWSRALENGTIEQGVFPLTALDLGSGLSSASYVEGHVSISPMGEMTIDVDGLDEITIESPLVLFGSHQSTTDENGHVEFRNLKAYEDTTRTRYVLYEEQALEGYLPIYDAVKLFSVEPETGLIDGAHGILEVVVENDYTKIDISKHDITTAEELPGATLQVFPVIDGEALDEPLYEWVSTDEPYRIERLPVGDYLLRETSAPDGYLLTEDVAFTVEDTDNIQKVVIADGAIPVEDTKSPEGTTLDKTGDFSSDLILVLAIILAASAAFFALGHYLKKRALASEMSEGLPESELGDGVSDGANSGRKTGQATGR
ncbi:MAG: hypothetical protein LBL27_03860 [Coriobacteriales bacterium]|jgi:hypothetical protein|nr:hypothetical protein [Coriobacteriales bacterium]